MSWLVTGVSGLLGATAATRLADRGVDVVGVSRRPPAGASAPHLARDLRSADGRAGLVAASGPAVVLHTAALASHEECERDPDAAYELNVTAAADLAAQARREGAAFIHISTDAVFDGERGGYRETDPTSPTSVYGRTKRDAEAAVLDVHSDALVARVNFYGWSPSGRRSLLEFFVNALRAGKTVGGFTDVTVSTLYAGFLVDALVAAQEAEASGILHVVSCESTTKFDFGRAIARRFAWDPERVEPIESRAVLELARGNDLSLDTSRYRATVGDLPGQAAGLDAAYDDLARDLPGRVRAFAPGEGP
ncbi:SDR family oxidoreductase [Microbacterium sp. NPDC055910]|uniref:SDR family oxidoreductase n=1 Tax=Microbacterium sp. NPDC055910 TaxID=3345659 RepID=UPI0035DC408F